MTKYFLSTVLTMIMIFGGTSTEADGLAQLSAAAFARFGKELDGIEKSKGADAAQFEIVTARKWIEDGKRLLGAGRKKKAAVYAERLPSQLDLVRVLVTTGLSLKECEKLEQEAAIISQDLKILTAKHNRLILRVHGTALTDAFPVRKEGSH
jgi:hypothetical protein